MRRLLLNVGAFALAFVVSVGVGYAAFRVASSHPIAAYQRRAFQRWVEGALPPPGDPARHRRSVYDSVLSLIDVLGPAPEPFAFMFSMGPPSPRENLVDVLHGADLRHLIFKRIVAAGYPTTYTPDSTMDLVLGQYSGGCRPRIEATPRTPNWGLYQFAEDKVSVDVVYPTDDCMDPAFILGHELGHASQTPADCVGRGVEDDGVKIYLVMRRALDPDNDASEIPQGLNDVCVMAEALRRFNGKKPDASVGLASEYRAGLQWMRRQAEEHGLFSGRPGTSMTELLASPSGKRWLKMLLERSEKSVKDLLTPP